MDGNEKSAQIIRLPLAAPVRLRAAMRSLDAALAAQRDSVAGWKDSLAALRAATGGLGQSLQDCNGTLDGVRAKAREAHAVAEEACRSADRLVAAATPSAP
jgi:hypothetical protein